MQKHVGGDTHTFRLRRSSEDSPQDCESLCSGLVFALNQKRGESRDTERRGGGGGERETDRTD